jgi:hypothetical protein
MRNHSVIISLSLSLRERVTEASWPKVYSKNARHILHGTRRRHNLLQSLHRDLRVDDTILPLPRLDAREQTILQHPKAGVIRCFSQEQEALSEGG